MAAPICTTALCASIAYACLLARFVLPIFPICESIVSATLKPILGTLSPLFVKHRHRMMHALNDRLGFIPIEIMRNSESTCDIENV